MKKFLTAVFVLAAVFMVVPNNDANAEDKYVAGGFEASGHIMAGAGYQHHNNKAPSYLVTDNDGNRYWAGPLGKYLGTAPVARSDHWQFFLDGVELDLAKSFGENIRLRADLNFLRGASSGAMAATPFVLEQGYATANIPVGNGIEFLLGRFNIPMGFEAADASQNDTISKSALAEGLRPTNQTGAKLYYAFSDLVDLHFYVVNSLYTDTTAKLSDIPSAGLRVGFNWGEQGTESTLGVSGIFGPESRVSNKHYTFGGDVDLNWWVTESFAVGAEAFVLRVDATTNTPLIVPTALAGSNNFYLSGLLNLHYVFSDVWDGTLKYLWAKQYQANSGSNFPVGTAPPTILIGNFTAGNSAGIRQSIQQIALAGGYAIADGAKLKLEGRFDIVKPTVGALTQYVYGGAFAFAYDF